MEFERNHLPLEDLDDALNDETFGDMTSTATASWEHNSHDQMIRAIEEERQRKRGVSVEAASYHPSTAVDPTTVRSAEELERLMRAQLGLSTAPPAASWSQHVQQHSEHRQFVSDYARPAHAAKPPSYAPPPLHLQGGIHQPQEPAFAREEPAAAARTQQAPEEGRVVPLLEGAPLRYRVNAPFTPARPERPAGQAAVPYPQMLWRGPKPRGGTIMNSSDLEFVIRNQMRNLPQANDPVEDFYYVEYHRRREGARTELQVPIVTLRKADVEAAKSQLVGSLEEGALGKLRKVNLKAPRQLLDVPTVNKGDVDELMASTSHRKRALLLAEKAFDLVYKMVEEGSAGLTREQEQEIDSFLGIAAIAGNDSSTLRLLMLTSKGRSALAAFFSRAATETVPQFAEQLFVGCLRHLLTATWDLELEQKNAAGEDELFQWLKKIASSSAMPTLAEAMAAVASWHRQGEVLELFSRKESLGVFEVMLQKGLEERKAPVHDEQSLSQWTEACDQLTFSLTVGFFSLIAQVKDLQALWNVMALLSSNCTAQKRDELVQVIQKASQI